MHPVISQLGQKHPKLAPVLPDVARALDVIADSFRGGGKLLLCGNGGSASDCDHIVGELMKAFLRPRPIATALRASLLAQAGNDGAMLADSLQGGLPSISLTGHPALALAIANDIRADIVFAQQVLALGRPGDVVLGISTSGNARNVINAFHTARALGLRTVLLTGSSGGKLAPLADVAVRVPATTVVDIQELHLPVYHALCASLEEIFFP
ncbi:MAG: SIS domain-containing protein [Opitutaceae bacterium]|jgi:D-sedoheptulose 7-phosphate isomerase